MINYPAPIINVKCINGKFLLELAGFYQTSIPFDNLKINGFSNCKLI